uniref:RdRp n=1 Tax=viral metagenome TaxID=1070528 RepID=A0A2V0R8Z4_9ZZZZ
MVRSCTLARCGPPDVGHDLARDQVGLDWLRLAEERPSTFLDDLELYGERLFADKPVPFQEVATPHETVGFALVGHSGGNYPRFHAWCAACHGLTSASEVTLGSRFRYQRQRLTGQHDICAGLRMMVRVAWEAMAIPSGGGDRVMFFDADQVHLIPKGVEAIHLGAIDDYIEVARSILALSHHFWFVVPVPRPAHYGPFEAMVPFGWDESVPAWMMSGRGPHNKMLSFKGDLAHVIELAEAGSKGAVPAEAMGHYYYGLSPHAGFSAHMYWPRACDQCIQVGLRALALQDQPELFSYAQMDAAVQSGSVSQLLADTGTTKTDEDGPLQLERFVATAWQKHPGLRRLYHSCLCRRLPGELSRAGDVRQCFFYLLKGEAERRIGSLLGWCWWYRCWGDSTSQLAAGKAFHAMLRDPNELGGEKFKRGEVARHFYYDHAFGAPRAVASAAEDIKQRVERLPEQILLGPRGSCGHYEYVREVAVALRGLLSSTKLRKTTLQAFIDSRPAMTAAGSSSGAAKVDMSQVWRNFTKPEASADDSNAFAAAVGNVISQAADEVSEDVRRHKTHYEGTSKKRLMLIPEIRCRVEELMSHVTQLPPIAEVRASFKSKQKRHGMAQPVKCRVLLAANLVHYMIDCYVLECVESVLQLPYTDLGDAVDADDHSTWELTVCQLRNDYCRDGKGWQHVFDRASLLAADYKGFNENHRNVSMALVYTAIASLDTNPDSDDRMFVDCCHYLIECMEHKEVLWDDPAQGGGRVLTRIVDTLASGWRSTMFLNLFLNLVYMVLAAEQVETEFGVKLFDGTYRGLGDDCLGALFRMVVIPGVCSGHGVVAANLLLASLRRMGLNLEPEKNLVADSGEFLRMWLLPGAICGSPNRLLCKVAWQTYWVDNVASVVDRISAHHTVIATLHRRREANNVMQLIADVSDEAVNKIKIFGETKMAGAAVQIAPCDGGAGVMTWSRRHLAICKKKLKRRPTGIRSCMKLQRGVADEGLDVVVAQRANRLLRWGVSCASEERQRLHREVVHAAWWDPNVVGRDARDSAEVADVEWITQEVGEEEAICPGAPVWRTVWNELANSLPSHWWPTSLEPDSRFAAGRAYGYAARDWDQVKTDAVLVGKGQEVLQTVAAKHAVPEKLLEASWRASGPNSYEVMGRHASAITSVVDSRALDVWAVVSDLVSGEYTHAQLFQVGMAVVCEALCTTLDYLEYEKREELGLEHAFNSG